MKKSSKVNPIIGVKSSCSCTSGNVSIPPFVDNKKTKVRKTVRKTVTKSKVSKDDLNTKAFDFSEALWNLKRGLKLSRSAWLKRYNSFIWVKPAVEILESWCKDDVLKNIVATKGHPRMVYDGRSYFETNSLKAQDTICKFSDFPVSSIMTGWVPSMEDLFATDWVIVK